MKFSMNVFLKIKNVDKIKRLKTQKNATGIKKRKGRFYIYVLNKYDMRPSRIITD